MQNLYLMKKPLLSILAILYGLAVIAQVTITDATINAGETYTMQAGTEYSLDGYVYVEAGATLVIEAGVVVKGIAGPSNGTDLTSAFIAFLVCSLKKA